MHYQHFLISGRVQGVFYRASAREQAHKLDLRGWVRNLPDGRVEALAGGSAEALKEFADWLREGPQGAIVNSVEISEVEEQSLPYPFDIRH